MKHCLIETLTELNHVEAPELPEPPGVYLYRSAGHRHECVELGYWNSALPFPRPALRAQCRLRSGSRRPVTRRRIEIVPPEKKDAAYVSKRLKDNEAAKRSGEKRKMKNLLLEGQLLALRNENAIFQDEVLRLRYLSMCASQDKAAPARDLCAVYSPAVSKAPIWWEEERSDAGIIRSFGWAPGFDSRPQSSALRPPPCGPASCCCGRDGEVSGSGRACSAPGRLQRWHGFPCSLSALVWRIPRCPHVSIPPGTLAGAQAGSGQCFYVSLAGFHGPLPQPARLHAGGTRPERRPGGRPPPRVQEPLSRHADASPRLIGLKLHFNFSVLENYKLFVSEGGLYCFNWRNHWNWFFWTRYFPLSRFPADHVLLAPIGIHDIMCQLHAR